MNVFANAILLRRKKILQKLNKHLQSGIWYFKKYRIAAQSFVTYRLLAAVQKVGIRNGVAEVGSPDIRLQPFIQEACWSF